MLFGFWRKNRASRVLPSRRCSGRQRADYRHAVEELRRNPERGFAKLDEIGAVKEVAWSERAQAIASAYVTTAGRSALVVFATHDEMIELVTGAIRGERKRSGELGESVVVECDASLGWTTAQKSEPRNFRLGQRLGFHRAVHGIEKNETVEVVRVEGRHVVVRSADGERKLTGKQATSFDVLESRSLEVAPGNRLLLTTNRREAGFRATNGEVVTVSRIDGAGRIELEDGRRLPADFHQFAYGCAVTAHRSQGKSVDAFIISADGMQKELFYVAASRGRQSIQVVTSDKARLQEAVGRSTARKSASELWRSAAGRRAPRGAGRGLAAAREMVRRAARFIASIPQRITERTQETRKERTHERGFGR